MAWYELGGKKKKSWGELLLESYGLGVGSGGGASGRSMFLGGGSAPGAQATPLGESPATAPEAAPVAKTPGMFTEGGVTYGEESMGLPPAERVPLTPEEIARRREAYESARPKYAAKRRETLLGEMGPEAYRRSILGAPPKKDVSWRQY